MGYFDDLSPERTWTPRDCTLCWDSSRPLTLMFPVKSVHFWRVTDEQGTRQKIRHESQQWFACDRCKAYVVEHRWDELAAELGHPEGYFEPLAEACLNTGWSFRKGGRAGESA